MNRDEELAASWDANAGRWTEAVRSGAIASRRLATDRAVLDAVLRRHPASALDLGCGEGWLCRALAGRVPRLVGIDGSAPLIEAAREKGGGDYRHLAFERLIEDPARAGTAFDAIIANFALLGEDLSPLLAALRRIVSPGGALVIQTLHPANAAPPYRAGWRTEDFSGFGAEAWQAMPWYFRTLADWLGCLAPAWRLERIEEPLNPETARPASLIIVAEPR